MNLNDATRQLAHVLRAENDALAAGDAEAAARLLPRKEDAAAALRAALPGTQPDAGAAAELRELAAENGTRLALAIEVQSRILEMVARAARAASPDAVQYGAKGRARSPVGAMALALRA